MVAEHVHSFDRVIASWPNGPDGETATMRQCPCGESKTFDDREDACHGCEGTCCTGVGSNPCTC